VVCAGHHHPSDCERARRLVAETRQGTLGLAPSCDLCGRPAIYRVQGGDRFHFTCGVHLNETVAKRARYVAEFSVRPVNPGSDNTPAREVAS
jgi:hypothetical protein